MTIPSRRAASAGLAFSFSVIFRADARLRPDERDEEGRGVFRVDLFGGRGTGVRRVDGRCSSGTGVRREDERGRSGAAPNVKPKFAFFTSRTLFTVSVWKEGMNRKSVPSAALTHQMALLPA